MTLAPKPQAQPARPYRVMIADDSAVVRGLVSRWLAERPEFEVVAIAGDGGQAVKRAGEIDADLCVLDVEMPVLSGLEALPKILALRPQMKVIMCSTLTHQGASVTLKALDLGAADYVAKPEATRIGGATAFRDELLSKLIRLGEAKARRAAIQAPSATRAAPAPMPSPPPAAAASAPRRLANAPLITVIGSSTGGPPALRTVLSDLGPAWPTPIAIVQHMPATFTKILAEHLSTACKMKVQEARHGEAMDAGCAYVAPGDWHLTLRRGPRPIAQLDQDPAENWCRPAVDKLYRSAAATYGGGVLAIILTGMGHDGREGARALVAKGATVLAQDEASSVVWGMPGAVVEAGLASQIAPISQIGQAAWNLAKGNAA
ncbi:MAG: chemotaxis response regulator protein-glutamate methylesterase [Caulobacteraceae bacterium]